MKDSLRQLMTFAESLPNISFGRDPTTGQFAGNAPLTTARDMQHAYGGAPRPVTEPTAQPTPQPTPQPVAPQGHKLRNTAIGVGALGVGYGGLKVAQAADAHQKSMPSTVLKNIKAKASGLVSAMTSQDRVPLGSPLPTHQRSFVDTAAHDVGRIGASLKDEASRVGKTVSQFLRRNAILR